MTAERRSSAQKSDVNMGDFSQSPERSQSKLNRRCWENWIERKKIINNFYCASLEYASNCIEFSWKIQCKNETKDVQVYLTIQFSTWFSRIHYEMSTLILVGWLALCRQLIGWMHTFHTLVSGAYSNFLMYSFSFHGIKYKAGTCIDSPQQ